MIKKISLVIISIIFLLAGTSFMQTGSNDNYFQKLSTDQQKWNYVYSQAMRYNNKPYMTEKIAIRYADVVTLECKQQNFEFVERITKQLMKESEFKWYAISYITKSSNERIAWGHGPMQISPYYIHVLYYIGRTDKELHDNLIEIETKTKFTQVKQQRMYLLKHTKKLTNEERIEYNKLKKDSKLYIKMCMKYFKRIGYGVKSGVYIMKHLVNRYDGYYDLALLDYWSGRNSDEFKFWSKKINIKNNHYVAFIMDYKDSIEYIAFK